MKPRFLDTVTVQATAAQPMPRDVARVFVDRTESGSGYDLQRRQEQVRNFTYWQYIAIHHVSSYAAHVQPQLGVMATGVAPSKQHLRGQRREFLNRFYGLAAQSVYDDVKPLPLTHPLAQLLQRINDEDTWCEFAYETLMFWQLCGVFYWWVIPNAMGLPAALWVVPSDWVEKVYGRDGLLKFYRVLTRNVWGREWEIPPEQMIEGKFKSPLSKLDGYGAMAAAPQWINNVEEIERSRASSFRSGVSPSALVQLGENHANPSEDLITQIKERFIARAGGSKRHGEPLIAPPGVTVTPWGLPPKEMEFADSSDQMRDDNLALHATPKTIVGLTDDVNRATFEGSMVQWTDVKINPLLAFLAAIMTEKLAARFDPRICCWFEDQKPRNADFELKQEQADFAMGAITPDEIRQNRGRQTFAEPAYETGYVGTTLVPLNEELREDLNPSDPDDDEEEPAAKPKGKGKAKDEDDE